MHNRAMSHQRSNHSAPTDTKAFLHQRKQVVQPTYNLSNAAKASLRDSKPVEETILQPNTYCC